MGASIKERKRPYKRRRTEKGRTKFATKEKSRNIYIRWYDKNKEKLCAQRREKYATNPEWRALILAIKARSDAKKKRFRSVKEMPFLGFTRTVKLDRRHRILYFTASIPARESGIRVAQLNDYHRLGYVPATAEIYHFRLYSKAQVLAIKAARLKFPRWMRDLKQQIFEYMEERWFDGENCEGTFEEFEAFKNHPTVLNAMWHRASALKRKAGNKRLRTRTGRQEGEEQGGAGSKRYMPYAERKARIRG